MTQVKTFFRYSIVGALGTAIDIGSLYVFVEFFHVPVLLAAAFSFLLAALNNFALNKMWTFRVKSKNNRKLFIKFMVVSLIGFALTELFMIVFIELFSLWYLFAKALTSLIVLVWNFLGNKLWTFTLKESPLHLPHFDYELSVVIPAYNESIRIKSTLLVVDDYLSSKPYKAEILVVDDGSKDDTKKVVESYIKKIPHLKVFHYSKNHGKGYAVKKGVEAAGGKHILMMDADHSTPIEELDKLMEAMKKHSAELVIGSRFLPDSDVQIHQPRYRIILGRAGNFLIRLFLIDGIKDTQCGFKLFKHKAAREIFHKQKVTRFGFDMEALVVASNLDYKIVEVPVMWFNSLDSRVRPIRDALITFKDLIYIKLNLWSGRYSSD